MTPTKPQVYTGTGSAIDNYNKPKQQLKNIVQGNSNNWGLFDKNNKQHLTVLAHLRTLQWTVKNDRWGEVADINRLSDFLKSDKSPVKKPLKKMDPQELSKIISCLESMITKKYK